MELHQLKTQNALATEEIATLKAKLESADARWTSIMDAARKELEDLRGAKALAQQQSLDKSKKLRELSAQLHATRQELETSREEKRLTMMDNDKRHQDLVRRMDQHTEREKAVSADLHRQLMAKDAALAIAVDERLLMETDLADAREAVREKEALIAELKQVPRPRPRPSPRRARAARLHSRL